MSNLRSISKILVIDDDPDLRRAVRASLTTGGFQVVEADGAEVGLQQAHTATPDLVICDLHMGRSTGWDVLRALRHDPTEATLPLILITASDDVSVMRQSMDLGADDFLHKPFSGTQLLAAVRARLKKQALIKAQAKRATQQLLGLLEATSDFVAIVDVKTQRVRYLNRAARRVTGLAADASDHSVLLSALHPPEAFSELETGALPTAMESGSWKGETEIACADGQRIHVLEEILLHRTTSGAPDYLSCVARDITRRKQAEQALQESENRFRTIARAAFDAIIMMDPQGLIAFWNPAAERIFGYSEPEVRGRSLHALLVPARYREAHERALRSFPSSGKDGTTGRTLELEAIHKNGTEFPVELSLSSVSINGSRHAIGVVRDVSRQNEATRMLRRERILLRTLIDALPDCIYAKDIHARKTLANRADVSSLGATTEEEVVGKTDAELLDARSAALCGADDAQVILRGEAVVNRHELIVNAKGEQRWIETTKHPLRDEAGRIIGLVGIGHDITERRRVEEELRRLYRAIEQSPASVVITDAAGSIEYVNAMFVEVTGYEAREVLGKNPRILKSGETSGDDYAALWCTLTRGQEWRGEFHNRKKNGELFWESAVVSPIKDEAGRITHFLAVKEDITERKRTEKERNRMELQLRHAQKMESIGQLAAGIAHEINTPTQFVGDNLRFLQDGFRDLQDLLRLCQAPPLTQDSEAALPPWSRAVQEAGSRADLDYLLEEIPKAIDQSLEGVGRVSKIVRAMKDFSHPGSEEKVALNINRALETTATVSRNEWKYVAELATDLDPDLPPVPCLPGEFNQIILNLIVNAAHAIADVVGEGAQDRGRITLATRRQGDWAEVRITDTGHGIPEHIRDRIFDPFFTTKAVGKGTGQGLAIAHSVVVDKHGGSIHFETELGRGTTFVVRLPLSPPPPTLVGISHEKAHPLRR